jgi:hypothetical protein
MAIPRFTAELESESTRRLNSVVPALLPRESQAEGYWGCMADCKEEGHSRGYCQKLCGGGAEAFSGSGSSGGSGSTKCAWDFYICALGCQAAGWPSNLLCLGACIEQRISCSNPF